MTSPAAQSSPDPRPGWAVCVTCGQYKKIAAKGLCWADYQATRRPRRHTPLHVVQGRRQWLREAKTAHQRVTAAEQLAADADSRVRTLARLAHANGVAQAQIAPLVGRSVTGVNQWIPDDQRQGSGAGGPGLAALDRLAEWRPLLIAAADHRDEQTDRLQEARRLRAEILTEANDPKNPARVGPKMVAKHLGVPHGTVQGWMQTPAVSVRPPRAPIPEAARCVGVNRGKRTDRVGERCRNRPRRGMRTCHDHRDQEPT